MDDLDDLFAQARTRVEPPSAALLARIEADALREQPRPQVKAEAKAGFGSWLAGVFGGWGGLVGGGPSAAVGLTLAAVSGLWLGLAQPVVADYMTMGAGMELLPSDTALWTGE